MLRALIVVVLMLGAAAASAQRASSMRVSGTVESFDGKVLAIKSPKQGEVKISIAGDAKIFGVSKGTLADVKPGAFVGIGGTPQPDGSQRAVQVAVFSETLCGTSKGFRPWSARPHGTMTNGAVENRVVGVEGQVLRVKYKGGEQKILVPADATIVAYAVGDKAELAHGAHVVVTRAEQQADGSLAANSVNVGRGDVDLP